MAGARLFAGAADAPRARRATDVLAVVLGAIGLLFLSLAERRCRRSSARSTGS